MEGNAGRVNDELFKLSKLNIEAKYLTVDEEGRAECQ